jgi:multidrug efflux pump subunit AcrB
MDRLLEGMAPFYGKMLPFCIKHRFLVFVVSIVIFCLSLFFIKILGKEFVPSEDQSRFLVNVICPVGSSVDYTDQMVRKCEEVVLSLPEVKGCFTATGTGRERLANRGIVFITLVPADERKRTQQELVLFLRKEFSKFAGMKAIPIDLSTQGFTAQRGYPIEFSIQGPDLNRLVEVSNKMMMEMENVPGIIDIDSNYDIGMPEVQVIPDRKKAADMGVDSQKIGETLNALVGGIDVAKFKDRGKRYDINMRLQAQSRKTPEAIGDLKVRNDQNELIPLKDLVTIQEKPSLLAINRYNRQRAITVTGNVSEELPQEQALKEVERVAQTILPPGYQIEFSGVAKTFQESFQSLVFALVMGVIVAYMILAAQFNHFSGFMVHRRYAQYL